MTGTPDRAFAARVVIPFIVITLIWGSTWIVIRDQLGTVPPSWSVSYRFAAAAAAMFAYVWIARIPLALGRSGHVLALILGLLQFVLNFNFVYRAEHYVTSGLVAVTFAALFVVNAGLGWVFLKQRVGMAFAIGSAIAILGIALLFYNEYRVMPAGPRAVAIGLGFTLLGVMAAAISNVMQASERAKRLPTASLIAWAMLYGAILDALWAWASVGAPTVEWRAGYFAGVFYLGVIGSAIAFTLYFGLIREIGPARAAYSGVLVPIIAMAISTVFENYRWSVWAIAGGILALAGLVIAMRGRDVPVRAEPLGRDG